MENCEQDSKIIQKKISDSEKENLQALGKRIRIIRGKDSQDTFAERLGISRGALSFYERGQNEPSSGTLAKICTHESISISWLMFGTGNMYDTLRSHPHSHPYGAPQKSLSANTSLASPMLKEVSAPYGDTIFSNNEYSGPIEDTSKLFLVPLVEARLSAGGGSFEASDQIERHYAFRHDFLCRKGNPETMVLMRVTGDSMTPDINNDDVVLIDRQQTQLRPGKIYAVGVEDMVYLKTVNAAPKQIILSSINPLYAPIILETSEHFEDLVRIIGRAIWIGRELG